VVAVVVLHMVLQLWPLHCMGVTVTVVVLYGVVVVVAIVVPHGATAAVIVITLSLDHKRGS